jgi:hypothetical protein
LHSSIAWGRFLAALLFVGLAGCTAVPGQELTTYREAFLEARNAGDLLYDEISAIIALNAGGGGTDECGPNEVGHPKCFDPRTVDRGGRKNEDASIRARRLSLELVGEYNLALIDLAEGKSATDLGTRIGEIGGLANDLLLVAGVSSGGLPALLAPAAVSSLKGLVTRLERLRANAAVRQSILDERETVEALIDELIADTPRMYKIYQAHQIGVWFAVARSKGKESPDAKAEFDRIPAYHEALAAYVRILERTREAQGRLIETTASGGRSVADLRAFIAEAIEIKNSAGAFWNQIRAVRG